MTYFPTAQVGAVYELDLDGSGAYTENISAYTMGCEIMRGRSSESQSASPGTMRLPLLNDDGRFFARNPTGPYYGLIGRNTRIRVRVPTRASRLQVPAGVASAATTADTAALSLTSDMDLRVDLELPDWMAGGVEQVLVGKWTASGNQRSYALKISATGYLVFAYSTAGTDTVTVTSTTRIPAGPIRQTLRATFDADNGASGSTTTFYTAPDGVNGTWTQLGDPVVGAVASVYDSTATLTVGSGVADTPAHDGIVYAAQVRSSIGGTIVANPDFTTLNDGTSSFSDASGVPWTINGTITKYSTRFTGYVAEWPLENDRQGSHSIVHLTANDVRRRLDRASSPLDSAYRRAVTSTVAPLADVIAYWPMTDSKGSSSIASPTAGVQAMPIYGVPDMASDSTTFLCSAPLPKMSSGAYFTFACPAATDGAVQAQMLIGVPTGGVPALAGVVSIFTTGTAHRWDIALSASGGLQLDVYSGEGVHLYGSGSVAWGMNGAPCRLHLSMAQNGSNVDWVMATVDLPGSYGFIDGTLSSHTVGHCTGGVVSHTGGLVDVTIGQLTIQSAVTAPDAFTAPLRANSGETAAQRVARICDEESIPHEVVGYGGNWLGAQLPVKLIDLLKELETSDAGILYSPRGTAGIGYRTCSSLFDRDPRLTVDAASGGILSITPVPDDQGTVNRCTATREGGSSYTHEVTTGPMSTADPPDGVGLYATSLTISGYADTHAKNRATWETHVGTVDEDRYPSIRVDLGASRYASGLAADEAQQDALIALDIGDRVVVTGGATNWASPDGADQIVVGIREIVGVWEWELELVCRPASPYRVGRIGTARIGGPGTVTTGTTTTTGTTLTVTPPAGTVWAHTTDYDIMVAGERMTVTAAGAVSGGNQDLTVTRSVNGVVKAHAAGEPVDLFTPYYLSTY